MKLVLNSLQSASSPQTPEQEISNYRVCGQRISDYFSEFGSVEKIEILPEKFPSDEYPNERYAYITYVDAKTAASVTAYHMYTSGLQILPANTWKQPEFIKSNQYTPDESVLKKLIAAISQH